VQDELVDCFFKETQVKGRKFAGGQIRLETCSVAGAVPLFDDGFVVWSAQRGYAGTVADLRNPSQHSACADAAETE
jgi:hypothetical protein